MARPARTTSAARLETSARFEALGFPLLVAGERESAKE